MFKIKSKSLKNFRNNEKILLFFLKLYMYITNQTLIRSKNRKNKRKKYEIRKFQDTAARSKQRNYIHYILKILKQNLRDTIFLFE